MWDLQCNICKPVTLLLSLLTSHNQVQSPLKEEPDRSVSKQVYTVCSPKSDIKCTNMITKYNVNINVSDFSSTESQETIHYMENPEDPEEGKKKEGLQQH